MLKISKKYIIFLLLPAVAAGVFCSCKTVPAGEAPPRVVDIKVPLPQNGEMTANEAVNFVATELAVNVLSGIQGKIKLLIRSNDAGNTLVRMVFNELKMFLPVMSVLNSEDYVLDSSLQKENGKRIWHIRLKDKTNKIIWYECVILKKQV